MEIVNSILVPYLVLVFFSLCVIDHSANFRGASSVFALILDIVSLVSIIGILTILIAIGVQGKWWIPILLAIGGLIISCFLKSNILKILGKNYLFVLSFLGLIVIPLTLFIIINKILF